MQNSKRLEFLDWVRFFAVLMVMAFHYTFNGIVNGKIKSVNQFDWLVDVTKYGYLGVELFFMVSGYVIFFSAQYGSSAKFAVSRAIRLYPAYWFSVLFTSFLAYHFGGELMSVTPSMVAVNLTMLQSFIGIGDVDGAYWTLAYEVRFYAAVFFVLLMGYQRHLRKIFIYWPAIFCIAFLVDRQHIIFAGSYYYYFCAGALFGVLREKYDLCAVLSLLITLFFCLTYSSGKVGELALTKGSHYSEIIISLIVLVFFLIFILQNIKKVQLLKLPFSKIVGSLTYPVYLIHAHFGYMLISHFATDENKRMVYPLVVILVVAVAYLIHVFVEVRLHLFWRIFFNSSLGRFVNALQAKLCKK